MKGQKARLVPLGRVATEMIEDYLKEARSRLPGDERAELLFLSGKGRPLARQIVAERVRKHGRRAGLRKTITPHCFRVTAATSMLRNGANLRYVQELLGHATVATLGPYLRLTVGDLKEAHGRWHPRAGAHSEG